MTAATPEESGSRPTRSRRAAGRRAVIGQGSATRVQLITGMSVHLADYHQETGTSPGELRTTGRADDRDLRHPRPVPADILEEIVDTVFLPSGALTR